MADVAIVAASVAKGTPSTLVQALAGATITAGQAVYLSAGSVFPCDPTFGGGTKAACVGIALNGGASGQTITYQTAGQITIGGPVVLGVVYQLSHNAAGLIAPTADVNANDYVTIVGIGISTTALLLGITVGAVQHG
jgi:hypothetical protein